MSQDIAGGELFGFCNFKFMNGKIKNWFSHNWFKLSILLIIIFVSGGWFYWFQLRPANIKHDCSWVPAHADPVTAVTQEEYNKCMEKNKGDKPQPAGSFLAGVTINSFPCDSPRPAQPAIAGWSAITCASRRTCPASTITAMRTKSSCRPAMARP